MQAERVPQQMGPFGFLQHERNPYPDEYTLLFWHDLQKDKIESYNADWREQSAWVNENVLQFRRGREALERPWLAIRDAYHSKVIELRMAQKRIKELERGINASMGSAVAVVIHGEQFARGVRVSEEDAREQARTDSGLHQVERGDGDHCGRCAEPIPGVALLNSHRPHLGTASSR